MTGLVFDVEAVAIEGAAAYLEPASAPANYRDQVKIAEYIAQANADALTKAALDVDLARIVAIGWQLSEGNHLVALAKTEDEERDMLRNFWPLVALGRLDERPTLIGFNCLAYDLPLLLRRSLYLGVKTPHIQVGKYRHDGVIDLMMLLSFDGALRYRSLAFYAKRFGLDVPPDPHTGADIAGLVAAGDWDGVANHCRSDIATTIALAKRVGVL